MNERKAFSPVTERPVLDWYREIVVAHGALDNVSNYRQERVVEASVVFLESLSSAFSEYSDYLREFLPVEHGAVLLNDNEVLEVYETKPDSMEVKGLGTLFGNTTHIHYPTRRYYFPDSYETVVFVAHERKQFPGGSEFSGFHNYRQSGAHRFDKVVDRNRIETRQWFIEDKQKELVELLDLLESKIIENSGIDHDILRVKRQTVIVAGKELQEGVSESKKENLPALSRKIDTLVEVLKQNGVSRLLLKRPIEIDSSLKSDNKLFFLPKERIFVAGIRIPGFLGPLGWLSVEREVSPEEIFDHVREIPFNIIRRATGMSVSKIKTILSRGEKE